MSPSAPSEIALNARSKLSRINRTQSQYCLAVVVALVVVVSIHWETATGIFGTWSNSVTYNHGFLVLPVAVWLLWRDKAALVSERWTPWWPMLAVVLVLGSLWTLGALTNIKSFRDLALVALIPVTVTCVLGRDFARQAFFPLAFVIFAWPFGEVFIPYLIDYTADFTVGALRVSGVPVFREGNNFVIPTGEWSVVQECSGVRYLLVSLFAGSLFAHLNFASTRRRLLFVALSVAVPIVANWLRAYGIVLLGHLSGNEIAVGVDHLVYGWVFFGVVMTALFYFGVRFMSEPHVPPQRSAKMVATTPVGLPRAAWLCVGAIIIFTALPRVVVAWLDHTGDAMISDSAGMTELPDHLGQWNRSSALSSGWTPQLNKPTAQSHSSFISDNITVEVHLARYATDSGASKLTTFQGDTMVDFDAGWHVLARRDVDVATTGRPLKVVERLVREKGVTVLVWQWGLIGDATVTGFVDSKIALLTSRLKGNGSSSTAVALATRIVNDDVDAGRARLTSFTGLLQPHLSGRGDR